MDLQGPVQWLHTEHLISEPLRQLFFSEMVLPPASPT
jgi:hypothetical protein